MPKPKSQAALDKALTKFEETFSKSFGEGRLVKGTSMHPYEIIPTGSITLDYKTGVGGVVEGRITEVWGPDASGKSTLCMWILREAQRKHPDKAVAWIDVEAKLDKSWLVQQGVNLKRLHIFSPENAEDVADAMKDIIRSGLFSAVVLDSIGAMLPEAEKQKDAEQAVMAAQAKIITRMVKIASVEAAETSTAVMLINQVRANLAYGADTMTPGGFALRHCSTMKFRLKRTNTPPYKTTIQGEKDVIVGHEIAVVIERNGVAPAYKTATFPVFNQPTEKFGSLGVPRADEAATLGVLTKVIRMDGAWYTLPGTGERFNGRPKLVEYLREHPDEVDDLRVQILATKSGEIYEEEQPEPEGPEVIQFPTGVDYDEDRSHGVLG